MSFGAHFQLGAIYDTWHLGYGFMAMVMLGWQLDCPLNYFSTTCPTIMSLWSVQLGTRSWYDTGCSGAMQLVNRTQPQPLQGVGFSCLQYRLTAVCTTCFSLLKVPPLPNWLKLKTHSRLDAGRALSSAYSAFSSGNLWSLLSVCAKKMSRLPKQCVMVWG